MQGRKLTQAEEKKMAEMYLSGVTPPQIAKKLEISRETVTGHLRNKPFYRPYHIIKTEYREEIRKRIKKGHRKFIVIKRLAVKNEVPRHRIRQWYGEILEEINSPQEQGDMYSYQPNESQRKHAFRLYQQGASIEMISKITHCRKQDLKRWVKREAWEKTIKIKDNDDIETVCDMCGEKLGAKSMRYIKSDKDGVYTGYVCSQYCFEEVFDE